MKSCKRIIFILKENTDQNSKRDLNELFIKRQMIQLECATSNILVSANQFILCFLLIFNIQPYNYKSLSFTVQMHDQIEQLLKNQHKDGQKVPLSHLRHAKTKKQTQRKADQQIQIEDKSKKLTKNTTGPSDTLYTYYCSLCGRLCLMSNSTLQSMPKRRTDSSVSINFHQNFLKLNLQRQRIKYFKRQNTHQTSTTENGIEVQYRWKCECGIPIGYTCITYELFEQARQNQNLQINNKPYFYCFSDGLVQKMKESKLISQLITYKETILLHLKRKTKK